MNEQYLRPAAVGDALLAASWQMWLASLGAAAVTRDWAEREAAPTFRKLVRDGTVVESRAMRIVGARIENSYSQANTLWSQARRVVATGVQAYARTARTLVRDTLPASLPKVAVTVRTEPAPTKRSTKRARTSAPPVAAHKRAGQSAKATRRSVKATKRG